MKGYGFLINVAPKSEMVELLKNKSGGYLITINKPSLNIRFINDRLFIKL